MNITRAQKLVDVYLDWLMTTDADAGWHGGSVLGRWHDFRGDIPESSGYVPTDSMEREMRYLRTPHRLLPEAREVLEQMPRGMRDPLLSWELYRNRDHTQRDIARWMGIKEKTYREKVSKGWAWLREWGEEQKKAA